MTNYLCIGLPPVPSVCKLTFPAALLIWNDLVTNCSSTAHLRQPSAIDIPSVWHPSLLSCTQVMRSHVWAHRSEGSELKERFSRGRERRKAFGPAQRQGGGENELGGSTRAQMRVSDASQTLLCKE